MILSPFDPWNSQICTCPSKLSLNPYTGCPHGCLYCYASSYIPRFDQCRPKADLLRRLAREAARVDPGSLVAMSNSSDPYPPLEKKLRLSRGCLEILKLRGLAVQVVTKSCLVVRDADLLAGMRACVALTLTTLDERLSRKLEPGAPLPKERLTAMKKLANLGVPVSVRIDPIIPSINDGEIEGLVAAASGAGVGHITSSTYKARPANLLRVASAFPEEGEDLKRLFARGEVISASSYLPAEIRRDLMQRVRTSAMKEGLTFSSCREGSAPPPGVHCDGSHLLAIKE
jgi:DNA repair photolyase